MTRPPDHSATGLQDQLPLADFAPAAQLPDPEELELRDLARLDGVPDALFTLIIANPRKPDLLSQHDCIRQLMADGYTESDIAAATGFNKSAINRRLRLAALIPDLRQLHQGGGLTSSCAEACARLPEAMQCRLADRARENGGKLTSHDVSEIKRVRAVETAAQLPASLFNTPSAADIAADADWRSTSTTRLTELLVLIPGDETETLVAIKLALQTITHQPDRVEASGWED